MKALIFNGPRDIRYEDYPEPKLASDNSAILKVTKSSICGSDLHIYHGEQVTGTSYSEGVKKFVVGHEFIRTWGNKIAALRHAVGLCDV